MNIRDIFEELNIHFKRIDALIPQITVYLPLNEDETKLALEMIDDRNLTSHTYHEEVADKIYLNLESYAKLMRKLLQMMKK